MSAGERRLRRALRRLRRREERERWWPRLTPAQIRAVLGLAATLAWVLWEQLRGRAER
jgi:hypothetical protein